MSVVQATTFSQVFVSVQFAFLLLMYQWNTPAQSYSLQWMACVSLGVSVKECLYELAVSEDMITVTLFLLPSVESWCAT